MGSFSKAFALAVCRQMYVTQPRMHDVWPLICQTVDLYLPMYVMCRPSGAEIQTECFCGNGGDYEQLGATSFITYGIGRHSTLWSHLLSNLAWTLGCKCEDVVYRTSNRIKNSLRSKNRMPSPSAELISAPAANDLMAVVANHWINLGGKYYFESICVS